MTKVVFFRNDGIFYGFRETGHTGYGEEGDDVLCAALSAMTMLLINSINVVFAGELDYTVDEGATEIMVQSKSALPEFEEDERKRYAISGLFMSYYIQLNDLMEEYYKYLQVEVIDKEYEMPTEADL
ncbi:MAG: ribosomal-processing cysteine protease Prp [Clostridia bacterium]|nr:ribosomal-processing cysteine protease Prp [Clostridia bacterium]MBQ9979264.1 ribosomal-processing cysteine protease Prp [Clostridia bacterium]